MEFVKSDINMNMEILIQKFLRDKTGLSRRAAGEMVSNGFVKKNGKVSVLGEGFNPDIDTIEFKGRVLSTEIEEKIYVVLNKPAGYLTSRFDPHNENTVYKLLPEKFVNLFPVGRLDLNTEGLLILTNDGDFTYRMTHPKFEIEKEYYVELADVVSDPDLKKIQSGLNTKLIKTAKTKIFEHKIMGGKSSLKIILHEGQKREVRRIFEAIGNKVTYLKRLRMGNIKLGNLKPGEWRSLNLDIISK
uniref:Pseudouridine synthase n=1 Tax=candidate division WWE3 bacterium TaxID=2053526 RepID=A0A7C4XV36_UNCKA